MDDLRGSTHSGKIAVIWPQIAALEAYSRTEAGVPLVEVAGSRSVTRPLSSRNSILAALRVSWSIITDMKIIHENEGSAPSGALVRHACLDALGLSVSAGAEVLGVSRQALNNVVNKKADMSPEMAIRLEKAFGSTADTWMRMQAAYDLAQVRRKEKTIKVRRYHRTTATA